MAKDFREPLKHNAERWQITMSDKKIKDRFRLCKRGFEQFYVCDLSDAKFLVKLLGLGEEWLEARVKVEIKERGY